MDTWMLVSLGGFGCFALAAVTLGVTLLWSRWARRWRRGRHDRATRRGIAAAAEELQLRETSPGVYEGRTGPGGAARRLRWNLREVPHPDGERLMLAFGTPVPTGQLTLTHRAMIYGVEPEELDLPPCKVGDAEFDVRFHVHADLEHLSILTPTVRRALLDAADGAELMVRGGWLWLDHLVVPELVDEIPVRIELLFFAAATLEAVPTEVEQRVRKLSQDDQPKVRAQTLELLSQRGASDFTTWIARALLSDPDKHVQARAVELAGDTSRMVDLAEDAKASPEVRGRVGRAMTLVGSSAEKLAVAKALARGPAPLPNISVDLCRSIGADAEPVLIDLVHSTRGQAVRQAVLLLGQLGSARSMVVLQALVDGAASDGVIRAEAKAALDRLRATANRKKGTSPPFSATPARPATRSGEPTRPLNVSGKGRPVGRKP